IISATCAFAAFAVVPFGGDTTLLGLIPEGLRLQVADVNVAILVVFAVASMSVYGIVRAGWSSNSKYSLLGGLRSSAQMISYEVSHGLAVAGVLVVGNSLSMTDIVNRQAGAWFGVVPKWFIIYQPVGFVIYLISGIAETNRAPFDFPEAEQELVAGYHTEYSSMSFAMFFLAEYINMVTVSAVATDLFLGGWHGPFLPESLGWIWFLLKVAAILFFYVWMRWTLPRYRYDQRLRGAEGPGALSMRSGAMRFGALLAAALIVELVWALTEGEGEAGLFPGESVSSVRAIGRSLFTDYALAFEVTSVLILVAM